MLLVGADKKRGREGIKAALLRHARRLEQTHFIAFDAAAGDILRDRADEGPQAVVVAHQKRQPDGFRVLLQTVAPGAVLGEGMDIRIIPVAGQVDPVGAQRVDGHVCAWRAADMHEKLHENAPFPCAPCAHSFLPLYHTARGLSRARAKRKKTAG